MEFISPTCGVCEGIDNVIDKIFEKIMASEETEKAEWTIAIGTDSQNRNDSTKFCSAILLIEKGNGGVYFYSTMEEKRHHVIQNRMLKEAELSIDLGRKVISEMEDVLLSDELIDKNIDISFEIHCDLGRNGKSKDSISAAIGWITSEFGGLVTPRIKPESTAASSIADKYTR